MRKFFGILYALFGCGFAALVFKHFGVYFDLVLGALAGLFFFAAWQAFSGGGRAWRIVHVGLGAVTITLWALCWAYVLPYVTGLARTYDMTAAGPLIAGFLGLILTVPAIAYLVDFVRWRRARRSPPGSFSQTGEARVARENTPAAPHV
jgi:hypothetical protein